MTAQMAMLWDAVLEQDKVAHGNGWSDVWYDVTSCNDRGAGFGNGHGHGSKWNSMRNGRGDDWCGQGRGDGSGGDMCSNYAEPMGCNTGRTLLLLEVRQ